MSKRLIIRGLLSLYKFPLFLVLGGGVEKTYSQGFSEMLHVTYEKNR